MRIAQVVASYPPYRGGMGNVAREYTDRLRARGIHVEVFTAGRAPPGEDRDHVHRLSSWLSVGQAHLLPQLVRRSSGFDIVHLHYPFYGGAEPVALRKVLRPRTPLVMTYHMDTFAGGFKGALFRAHRLLLLGWIASRADRILVSTMDYAETAALGRHRRAMKNVEVHPFGVDSERFHPGSEQELRGELGIPADAPVVVFVAGLDRAHDFKGLPVLLDALAGLRDRAWRCVVIGDGDLRAGFERDAERVGLGGRVHFLGSVTDQLLPRVYRMSDLHCFPSTRRGEAFGLVALEAAASGLASVASDLPGVRAVVLDGETGLLVPPGRPDRLREAIDRLLTDGELRRRLGARARQRAAADFSWDAAVHRVEATYREVLGERGDE